MVRICDYSPAPCHVFTCGHRNVPDKQIREQISQEWIRDLELVSAENSELERHREDAICLDKETAERDRRMVFDHGEGDKVN